MWFINVGEIYKKDELLTTSPVETGVKENYIWVFGWEETVNL